MKRLLVLTFVFFLLGNNVARAIDVAGLGSGHEDPSHGMIIDGDTDHHASGDSCDHCCHVSAHFTGIITDHSLLRTTPGIQRISTLAVSHTTRAYQPPLPPPNA